MLLILLWWFCSLVCRISKSYGSYYELLADPSINAVYIGLPNGLHGKWAKRYGGHYAC